MATPFASLSARGSPLKTAAAQLEALQQVTLPKEFEACLEGAGLSRFSATGLEVLQLNVGKLCNQTCRHCHVDAGPDRMETMSRQTMEACLGALENSSIPTVDITGGAPELNPNFRWLVEQCRALGRHVMNRCNLTVL